jgi:heptosyltransferase-3
LNRLDCVAHVHKLKALIIRPSALGDTLLLAPALYQIAGKTEVTLLGRSPGVDFLRPLVHGCGDYERGSWHKLFSQEPDCGEFPFPEVDRVVCFLSDPAGKVKQGLNRCLKGILIHSFRPFPAREQGIHVAFYLASCLKESGFPVDPERAIADARTRGVLLEDKHVRSENTVVFHPGSGSRKKNYPPEFWLDLIRGKGLEAFRKKVVLLGPAEEQWHQLFATGLSGTETEIVISPHRKGLLSLLKAARLYIGHDSGITHLAAMLGTFTIGLFRKSDPQWAPLGPGVTVITGVKQPTVIYKKIQEKLNTLWDFCLD